MLIRASRSFFREGLQNIVFLYHQAKLYIPEIDQMQTGTRSKSRSASAVQAHPYIKLKASVCCITDGRDSWGTATSQTRSGLAPESYSQTQRPSGIGA